MLGNLHVSVRWGEVGALEIQDLASYPTPPCLAERRTSTGHCLPVAFAYRSLDSQLVVTQLSVWHRIISSI